MNLKRILRTFVVAAALTGVASTVSSCDKDDPGDGSNVRKGQIVGIITGNEDALLSGVTVSLSGITESGVVKDEAMATVVTKEDGVYTFDDVPLDTYVVTFALMGYQTVNMTVSANQFKDDVVKANIQMSFAAAKIKGLVTDARNGNKPLEGVTVSVTPTLKAISAADGTYVIENLAVEDYSVTFSKTGYPIATKAVSKSQFIDAEAMLNFILGAPELLRGKTINDLRDAGPWYYNEYRGGRNGGMPWDWSCDFMCTLNFEGAWAEQNEGTTLQIRNKDGNENNPVNLDLFDSYVYGRKKISEENKMLTVLARTHEGPAVWGVQVVDLSAAMPTTVKIGETLSITEQGDYKTYNFDLSAYIGKEVIVAIGDYRAKAETGYWIQLVLRRIAFAATNAIGDKLVPGTEVTGLEGWRITKENVRSMMPTPLKKFVGVSKASGNRDNYVDGYRSWRPLAHIGVEWAFMPINKDTEPFANEGFVIKTRGGGTAPDLKLPESYFYAKFAIAEGNNEFTLNTRNFSSNPTYFKVTAVTEDGVATHLSPASNTAQSASAADEGCWKFVHQDGGQANPEKYASFVYDLKAYNGKNVVLIIGVFKGEDNGDESKLVFHSMSIN